MRQTTRRIFALLLLGCSMISLTACNTTKGAGKDLEKTGEAIQDGAEKAKP